MKNKTHRLDNSTAGKVFDVFNTVFIILFCISILFPVWDMIVKSLSDSKDISFLSINLFPKHPTLETYKYCLSDPKLLIAAKNSVLRTIIGTLYHLIVCSLAAFALTRTGMPLLKPITALFLITMFFSGGLIPSYLNIKDLGLMNTFWVYVIPGGFSMYNTLIIRNYFFSIDRSMEEAATVDGASMLQIMLLIIIPLSKPVLATVGLWQMVGQWNSWFDNMIYARDESLLTLQYMLRRIMNDVSAMNDATNAYAAVTDTSAHFTSETVIAATTMITILPIICVYPFLQKYFVKGIMLGAVKG